ncbi:MAG: TolC family protein, partial [Proteobacteria bacterium]|nr:TolC family protein [Pseudomonadota bacterium]
TALSQNASLVASRLAADIAHDNYLTAIGGHLPQINASASRSWDLSNSNTTNVTNPMTGQAINTQDIVWSVGVTVPIFSAGATQSKVRQAHYLWNASKSGYELTLRQTEQLARDSYQGVISQIAQVGALKQAVESNQISLQATEAGYEVGTKTAIDVLSARQALVQAQTNYAQAKYAYLNNIIALRLAAGNLDRATIAQINSWLVQPPPPAPDPATTGPAAAPAAAPAAPAAAPAAPATSPDAAPPASATPASPGTP